MFKKLISSILILICLPVYGTDLTVDFANNTPLTAEQLNTWKATRDGDLFPISPTTKNYTNFSGSLGSSTYKWKDGFIGGGLAVGTATTIATGNIKASGTITASGNILTSGTITGALATAAQPNVTSLGTLTGLTVSGGLNVGTATVAATGEIKTSDHITTGGFLVMKQDNAIRHTDTGLIGGTILSQIYTSSTGLVYINPTNSLSIGSMTSISGGLNVGTATNAATGQIKLSGGITCSGDILVSGGLNVGTTGAGTGQLKLSSNFTTQGNIYAAGSIVATGSIISQYGITAPTFTGAIDDETGSGYNARLRVVDIGNWDMDATPTISVDLRLGQNITKKILLIQVMIYNDDGLECYDLNSSVYGGLTARGTTGSAIYSASANKTWIVLARTSGGFFDNTAFNEPVYSRGKLAYWYAP